MAISRKAALGAAAAALIGVGGFAWAQTSQPGGPAGQAPPAGTMGPGMMGPGMMGPGMMGPGMMGPGMMGYGMPMMGTGMGGCPMMGPGMMGPGMMGPGMMGPGMMGMPGAPGGAPLSADDVRQRVQMWLDWQRNPRLRVGEVRARDDGMIVADVVTREGGALVDRILVNSRTGFAQHAP